MGIQSLSRSNTTAHTSGNYLYPAIPVSETSANGFINVNQQWDVTYWNKAAEKILGITAKKIIGKNLWAEFANVFPLHFYANYHKLSIQDIPVHFKEYWAEKAAWFDVITYYCDGTLYVSFKSSSHVKAVRPKQQLKIFNEIYRFATVVSNNCLWEWDIQKRELFWIDGGHQRTFGYAIENAIIPQIFWENCLHPDDKARVLAGLQQLITERNANMWEEEYRFRKANGEYAYVHDRGQILDNGNNSLWMVGATEDITARKLAEIKSFENEKKLSIIARQAVNPVIIIDATQRITWINEAFTNVTGYSLQEVVGLTQESILHGKETDISTVRYLQQKMKLLQPFDCEILYYTKPGHTCWMHVQGQALLDEKGNCEQFFSIQTDVTEKVLLEKKLLEERITKQKEITDAVITAQEHERAEIGKELHDNVNQVLGAAKLYIEMAKADVNNKDVFLTQACGHLLYVIEEIRKISKTLIPQSMNLIGLGDSISILLEDISRIHPVKIKFKDEGIDKAGIDEKMKLHVFRIVQEQVNNILKHSEATSAKIILRNNRNTIALIISDNGKGCDTTERKKGVGIRNIMSRTELYHGKLIVTSSPGKGYELNIRLAIPEKDNTV
ncbi:MAG: PAS domain S-box protein [Bacteroidota bacterium]